MTICPACQYPSNSIPAANPETVVMDFGWTGDYLAIVAREQRENLPGPRSLCEFHRENYVRVVEAIEVAAREKCS